MKDFIVALFGHRKIDTFEFECLLAEIVEELIKTKNHVTFLLGRNGEFDEYSATVIKRVKRKAGDENSSMVLVLPYKVANIEYYADYYDDIIIPDVVCDAHPKAAITLKNHWMVEQSDLVITYVEKDDGGAHAAMKYAESLKKSIINLYGNKEILFTDNP